MSKKRRAWIAVILVFLISFIWFRPVWKKFLSKVLVILLLVFVIFPVSMSYSACSSRNNADIPTFVLENEELLRKEAEEKLAQYKKESGEEVVLEEAAALIKDAGIWQENAKICVYSERIVYCCSASGLLTATAESGFYYSADDTPFPAGEYAGAWFFCEDMEMTEDKDGNIWYIWYEEGSTDNYSRSRKICDNFYYYQAGN